DTHTVLNTTDSDAVQAVVLSLQISEFNDLISCIYSMTFALKLICQSDELMERMGDHSVHHLKTDFKTQSDVQGSDVPQSSDENHADVIMTVHTQFLHLVKIYKLIKAGTKHGDVGLLFWGVEQSILHFAWQCHFNYAVEMLYF
ncbi:hypothetical protein LOZ52_006643, partial [Ophidiomyces ophidiicola]